METILLIIGAIAGTALVLGCLFEANERAQFGDPADKKKKP